MQTQKMEQQVKSEDAALDKAIKSIQTTYKDIDFAAKDENGLSLEQRVLDFAMKNHFTQFEDAFKVYYHDQLVKSAEARGKESIMQEMKKRQKLGLLDESPAPGKSSIPFGNGAKPRSWNDPQLSADSILREFKFA